VRVYIYIWIGRVSPFCGHHSLPWSHFLCKQDKTKQKKENEGTKANEKQKFHFHARRAERSTSGQRGMITRWREQSDLTIEMFHPPLVFLPSRTCRTVGGSKKSEKSRPSNQPEPPLCFFIEILTSGYSSWKKREMNFEVPDEKNSSGMALVSLCFT